MPRQRKVATTAEMLEAARLFYRQKLQKREIARRLSTDIRAVTWLLKQAEDQGLVKVYIHETTETDLQHRVLQKFPHLKEALIVSVPSTAEASQPTIQTATKSHQDGSNPRPDAEILRRLAVLAAEYFDRLVDNQARRTLRVGVTGGESLLEFANAVPDRKREGVHFYPTALVGRGRSPSSAFHVDAVANATILWARSGRFQDHCHYATVSPYDSKKRGMPARAFIQAELKRIADSTSIKAVVKEMDKIDIAFAGVGIVNPTGRMTMTGLLNPIVTAQELRDEGAVADFCYNLIDDQGLGQDRWQFFLTAGHYSQYRGLAFFHHMVETGKRVVAIAGPRKLPAVMAALKAKVFNVWITDSATANEALNIS
jgi:DNA-binding transcriptional regulator LsrR (DeoR family)